MATKNLSRWEVSISRSDETVGVGDGSFPCKVFNAKQRRKGRGSGSASDAEFCWDSLQTSETVEGCGDGSAKTWAHLSLQASELETFSPGMQIV